MTLILSFIVFFDFYQSRSINIKFLEFLYNDIIIIDKNYQMTTQLFYGGCGLTN